MPLLRTVCITDSLPELRHWQYSLQSFAMSTVLLFTVSFYLFGCLWCDGMLYGLGCVCQTFNKRIMHDNSHNRTCHFDEDVAFFRPTLSTTCYSLVRELRCINPYSGSTNTVVHTVNFLFGFVWCTKLATQQLLTAYSMHSASHRTDLKPCMVAFYSVRAGVGRINRNFSTE